jgi:TonB family protein
VSCTRCSLLSLLLLLAASGLTAQETPSIDRLVAEGRFAEATAELVRSSASGAQADDALLRKVVEATRDALKDARLGGETRTAARRFLCLARAQSSEELAPAESQEPVRVGGKVQRPELISQIPPVYTEEARQERVTGTVTVESIIDQEGCIRQARVLKGLPHDLSEAATDAVTKWVFAPATLKGRPVKVYYVLTINFGLEKKPEEMGGAPASKEG